MTAPVAVLPLTPESVMSHPKFPWSDYLQRHLTSPSVVVSSLHPIFGLRLAALFIHLTATRLASDTPGQGTFQIRSGVRSKELQIAYWNADLKAHGGRPSGGVANPYTVHGVDAEGVQRAGSNHMQQVQSPIWGAKLGYAVDLYNARGADDAAWLPLHQQLGRFGLDWPLKPGRNPIVERWHIEWFSRSASGPYPGTIAWPDRPGVHRPLFQQLLGGDVRLLQGQANKVLGLRLTATDLDGIFGPATTDMVRNLETRIGRPADGVWTEPDQVAFEQYVDKANTTPPPAKDATEAIRAAQKAVADAAQSHKSALAALEAAAALA